LLEKIVKLWPLGILVILFGCSSLPTRESNVQVVDDPITFLFEENPTFFTLDNGESPLFTGLVVLSNQRLKLTQSEIGRMTIIDESGMKFSIQAVVQDQGINAGFFLKRSENPQFDPKLRIDKYTIEVNTIDGRQFRREISPNKTIFSSESAQQFLVPSSRSNTSDSDHLLNLAAPEIQRFNVTGGKASIDFVVNDQRANYAIFGFYDANKQLLGQFEYLTLSEKAAGLNDPKSVFSNRGLPNSVKIDESQMDLYGHRLSEVFFVNIGVMNMMLQKDFTSDRTIICSNSKLKELEPERFDSLSGH
jgi:hypothetical protein